MKANCSRITLCGCLAVIPTTCNPLAILVTPGDTIPSQAAVLPVVEMQQDPVIVLLTQGSQNDGTPMTRATSTATPAGLQSLIEKAKEDLAQRLSMTVRQISLVEAKEVVWPDTSIGCPQAGMAYLQVPKDGALIVLQAEGVSYAYHTGGSRGLFLCEKVYKEPHPTPKIDRLNRIPSPHDWARPDNSIPPGEDR